MVLKVQFEYIRNLSAEAGMNFLYAIDIMSVPVRKYDAYGLYILESNAAGIPVVQPSTGAFPEILEMTGGGLLYRDDTVNDLTQAITKLLNDKKLASILGETGKKNVREKLTLEKMSAGLNKVYGTI